MISPVGGKRNGERGKMKLEIRDLGDLKIFNFPRNCFGLTGTGSGMRH